MQSRDRSLLGEILPPEERAIEKVVARYLRVAPAVTRFARSFCGNDELRVVLGADSSSSLKQIVISPGVFQAAYARSAPVTPSEVALASALHEIVHLVSTDLEEKRPLPDHWFGETADVTDGEFNLLDALGRAGGKAAESLFFALEDARQERQGLELYPGAFSVLTDLYQASVTHAINTTTPLGQFSLCCFLLTGGHADRDQLEKKVDNRVSLALADAQPFIEAVSGATDPWEVADLALQLVSVARLHRIITLSSEMEQETKRQKEQREEDEQQSIADGVDRVRLMSPILQNAESYEHTKDAAESRAGESPERGSSEVAGQEATDQILRISEAPTVYLPNGHGGKLMVSPFPDGFRSFATDGRQRMEEAAKAWGVTQQHITGELYPLFVANQRRGLQSGFDAGDLSPHAPLMLAGGLYSRMYERRAQRTRRSYAVSLLVDGSASMLQPRTIGDTARKAPWGLSAATLGAWSLALLCDRLQIDFEVAVFNRSFAAKPNDTEWEYTRRQSQAISGLRRTQGSASDRLSNTVNHYLVKTFTQRWRSAEESLAGLFLLASDPRKAAGIARKDPRTAPPVAMFAKGANVDEYNLNYAAQRLGNTGATVRVLVVLADGMTRGSVQALADSVRLVESAGTIVLGIGIGDKTVEGTYDRHQVVEHPEALTSAMVEGVRDALRRSLTVNEFDSWWARTNTTQSTWKETVNA